MVSPKMENIDVLVVGAGPAGMAAAVRASESGRRVLMVDDNPDMGGQIWRGGELSHTGRQSSKWFSRVKANRIPVLAQVQVIAGSAESRTLLAEGPDEAWELRYGRLVIAAGAREIFLPFPGWTLPGVTGVGGLQALVKSGVPISGKRVVIAGSGPLLLAVAANLRRAGARVKLIGEQARRRHVAKFAFGLWRHPDKFLQAVELKASLLGVPFRCGCWVEAAEGSRRLERVRLRQAMKTWTEDCDYAAVAYGLYPNNELAALLGCRLEGPHVAVDEWQRTSQENIYSAGECSGIGGVDLSLAEGEIAGYAAGGQLETAKRVFAKRVKARDFAEQLNRAYTLREELRKLPEKSTFVCRCEDVRYQHLERLSSFRAAKLHTRCGMGACQGRICGPATEFLFGWRTDSIRPPIFPSRVSTLAIDETMPDKSEEARL